MTNSNNNNLTGNNVTAVDGYSKGLRIENSHNNSVTRNVIITFGGNTDSAGIYVATVSANNTLSSNNVTTTGSGAYGFWSDSSSSNNTLTGNQFNTSQAVAVYITGTTSAHYNQSIDATNLAEGYPINFTFNAQNVVVAQNLNATNVYGQIVCAWCNNVTYQNVTMGNDGFGLYASNNSLINASIVTTSKGYGVFVAGSSSTNLMNNTINLMNITTTTNANLYGVYFLTARGNNVTNSNVTTNGVGIFLVLSSGNNLANNTIRTLSVSAHGIFLSDADSNNLSSNTITVISGYTYGIYVVSSLTNILSSNIVTNWGGIWNRGIYIQSDSISNNVLNNTITTSGNTGRGIEIHSSCDSNNLTNNTITTGGIDSYGIYLRSSSTNNLVKNTFINATVDIVSDSGINNFTNCTFNKSKVTVTSTGSLNVFWYADVRTVTSGGADLGTVNVNVSNVNGTSIFNGTTNSTGWLARQTILEYMQNASGIYNYTPHWFNASKTGYNANNTASAISENHVGANAITRALTSSAGVVTSINWVAPTFPDNQVFNNTYNWSFYNASFTNTSAATCLVDVNGTNYSMTLAGQSAYYNFTPSVYGNYSAVAYCNTSSTSFNSTNKTSSYAEFCRGLSTSYTMVGNASGWNETELAGTWACFWMHSNNDTVLDCNGNSIVGDDRFSGIHVSDVNNITVKNCVIRNYDSGIYFEANEVSCSEGLNANQTAYNNSVYSIVGKAISISGSCVNVSYNTLASAYYGVSCDNSDNATIAHNSVTNSTLGMEMHNCNTTTILNNSFDCSTVVGTRCVYLTNSDSNYFENNSLYALGETSYAVYLDTNSISNNFTLNNINGSFSTSAVNTRFLNNTLFSYGNAIVCDDWCNNSAFSYSKITVWNAPNGLTTWGSNISVVGNNITIGGSATAAGIYRGLSPDLGYGGNDIKDNLISVYSNRSAGIGLSIINYSSTVQDVVRNNSVWVYSGKAEFYGTYGLFVDSTEDTLNVLIANNTVTLLGTDANEFGAALGAGAVKSVQFRNLILNSTPNPLNVSFTLSAGLTVSSNMFNLNSTVSPADDPTGYSNLSKYLNISNTTSNDAWVFLNISYSDSDVPSGYNASNVKIQRYNGTAWNVVSGSGTNRAGNYSYANLTEFSVFGAFAGVLSVPVIPQYSNRAINATNNSQYNPSTAVQASISWTNESTVVFNWNGANYTITTPYQYYLGVLGAGSYSNYWCANSSTGDWNCTATETFTVLQNSSDVCREALNGTQNNVSYSFGQTTNTTGWLTVTEGAGALTLNGSVVANPLIVNLGGGYWLFNYSKAATQNYSACYIERYATVTQASSNAVLLLNGTGADYSVLFGQTSNASGYCTGVTPVLYRNGSVESNPEIASLSAGFYNYTVACVGNNNYSTTSATHYLTVIPNGVVVALNSPLDNSWSNATMFSFTPVTQTFGFVNATLYGTTRIQAQS
jgi:parallel beta-helix repeat protein